MLSISTVNGEYARDESISDVTASFWTAMREELLSFGNETVSHEVRDTVRSEMTHTMIDNSIATCRRLSL